MQMMLNCGKFSSLCFKEFILLLSQFNFLVVKKVHLKSWISLCRFLHQKESNAYLHYRHLVETFRREMHRSEGTDETNKCSDKERHQNVSSVQGSPLSGKETQNSNENGQQFSACPGTSQGYCNLISNLS